LRDLAIRQRGLCVVLNPGVDAPDRFCAGLADALI
jgi:hypothetical protein